MINEIEKLKDKEENIIKCISGNIYIREDLVIEVLEQYEVKKEYTIKEILSINKKPLKEQVEFWKDRYLKMSAYHECWKEMKEHFDAENNIKIISKPQFDHIVEELERTYIKE